MPPSTRATIYLEASLHRALRLKAAETYVSISALVNSAVRESFAEDAGDLMAFRDRINEPRLKFDAVALGLKKPR